MAKSVRTSPTSGRMSSIVSGDPQRASRSVLRSESGATNVQAGAPVTNLGANIKSPKTITDRVPAYGTATNVPATPRQNIRGGRGLVALQGVLKQPTVNAPKATVVAKPVVAAPVKKPAASVKKPAAPVKKPPVQVISNVVRERPTPTKAAPPARAKPPATRFGVVTGTTTGTKTGGGGGYGGGGTRGGGSLSGGGSGSRSAGTSRTGGTQRNDPVRG